jgi:hypothetical protein
MSQFLTFTEVTQRLLCSIAYQSRFIQSYDRFTPWVIQQVFYAAKRDEFLSFNAFKYVDSSLKGARWCIKYNIKNIF